MLEKQMRILAPVPEVQGRSAQDIAVYREWLSDFFTEYPPLIRGDDEATTNLSMSVVLVASALTRSRSYGFLAEVTGFPRLFVLAVLCESDRKKLWNSERRIDLDQTLHSTPLLAEDLENARFSVMEEMWMAWSSSTTEELDALRERRVFGGLRQDWRDNQFGAGVTIYDDVPITYD